ncbi:MAG: hypothetical protein BroJett040_12440 [Oligoflexia bacterium]|nr:MAG: hypothetical protein BroJett040_12440 [Oligoflexia bacterium]
MQAKLKNEGEFAIVSIQGSLEIERAQFFREVCKKQFANEKVIFNMEKACFVGSTGIQSFLDAMRIVSEKNSHGLCLVGLKPEFKRIFDNLEMKGLRIFEDESAAIRSFDAACEAEIQPMTSSDKEVIQNS